ncbi:cadherin-like domain-containing protein [Vibrio navarrensis]|uniref:Cadherin-like domain-containing protein n=1 Tax=Vibrio navarrensis TaxID=29495 RepID=A0AAJ4IDQ7_9VIBR|nr:cadherin-like domain-containing protein [Vibrio navarrensis]
MAMPCTRRRPEKDGALNRVVVIAADGAMTFEPAADFNGEINFGYQVKDADGDVDSANVKVTVNAVNDAVDAVNDEVTVAEDGSITLPNGQRQCTRPGNHPHQRRGVNAMPKTSRWTMGNHLTSTVGHRGGWRDDVRASG